MRLLRVKLDNFRSHVALDLDLSGVQTAAIVGRNGAGKSSIFEGVDWCLYGGQSGDALLRHQSKQGGATVELEVGEHQWRVNRGRERGRKSWLVIEQMNGGAWAPVPFNRIEDAQAFLDASVLPMDRDAFAASVYAPQGDAGALAGMKPADRKALLGGLLELDAYEEWRSAAAADARSANERAEGLAAQRQAHVDRVLHLEMEPGETVALEAEVGEREREIARLDGELEAAVAREEARTKVEKRATLVAQMRGVRQEGKNMEARNAQRRGLREQLAGLEPAREAYADWEQKRADHQEVLARARAEREAFDRRITEAQRNSEAATAAHTAAERRTAAHRGRLDAAKAALAAAEAVEAPEGDPCPTCGQEVHGDAHARVVAAQERRVAEARAALTAVEEEQEAIDTDNMAATEEMEVMGSRVDQLREEMGTPPEQAVPAFDQAAFEQARADAMLITQLEGQLQGVGLDDEDPAALKREWDALKVEAERLPEMVPEGPTPMQVQQQRAAHEGLLAAARTTLERVRARGEEIARLNAQITGLDGEVDEQHELVRARTLVAAACSRNGIPAMVLDNAVQGIEGAANDALDALGSGMRLRLVTQVAKASGKGQKETLEILVDDGSFERPLSSFSGGEKYRVHIALRMGLAAMFSAGSGRQADLLLIDEPTDLDAEGVTLLAEMLARLPLQVLLVTHLDELVHALPQRITVTRSSDLEPSAVEIA